jgi:hypothetical protein
VFGRFISEQEINGISDPLSDWQSFKLLLPGTVSRLFSTPVMSESEALQMVQEALLDALQNASDAAGFEHDACTFPAKPI